MRAGDVNPPVTVRVRAGNARYGLELAFWAVSSWPAGIPRLEFRVHLTEAPKGFWVGGLPLTPGPSPLGGERGGCPTSQTGTLWRSARPR
jgi:hypothetical protein